MAQPFAKAATLLVAAFSISTLGCTHERVRSNLAEREVTQLSDLRELKSSLADSTSSRLLWKDAVRRLEKDNQGLKRSRLALSEAKRAKKEIWNSLVPRVSLFVGLSTLLGDLADSTLDDVNGQIRAAFNIPSPFNFYGQLYGAELGAISAEWSHEVDRRRARRELYVAFQRAQDLELQLLKIERDRDSLSEASLDSLPSRLQALERAGEDMRRNQQQSRLSLNRLLGTPGGNWRPAGALPRISYADRVDDLKFGENFGKLGLKLEVANIERAHLAVDRVKLQRWPALSFGLAGPAIFSSNSSTGEFALENFNIFAGVTDNYDLTNPLDTKRIQLAEIRLEATLAQIRIQMESEITQFEQSRVDYRNLQRARDRAERQLEFLQESTTTSATRLLENFNAIAALRESIRRLRLRQNRLDLDYWVWDDQAW